MFKFIFALAAFAALGSHAVAQQVITGTASNTNAVPTTFASSISPTPTSASYTVKYNDTKSDYPMKTILIPLNYIGNVAASVITAAPDSTVYALACLHLLADGGCPETPSITMTEGESTLMYTATDSNPAHGPTTINCALTGGARATQVVCTGTSSVSGVGALSSASTLSGSQLSYIPVSITAGAEKLSGIASATATTTGSGSNPTKGSSNQAASATSSGAGVMATAARIMVGGAAGLAILGAM